MVLDGDLHICDTHQNRNKGQNLDSDAAVLAIPRDPEKNSGDWDTMNKPAGTNEKDSAASTNLDPDAVDPGFQTPDTILFHATPGQG